MKNFDERIRDKVFGAEMPVSDKLWSAIDSELDKKQRRPGLWLMVLIPLFLAPIGLLTLSTVYNSGNLTNSAKGSFLADDNVRLAQNNEVDIIETNTRDALLAFTPVSTKSVSSVNSLLGDRKENLSFQISSQFKVDQESDEYSEQIVASKKISSENINNINLITWEPNPIQNLFAKGGAQCPQFRSSGPEFYAYSNFSSSLPFQSLSNSELDDYIDLRNSTESSAISYSADLGVGIDFRNGYFIETGLMIDQINMRFNHKETVIRNTSFVRIDTFYDTSGEIVDITESVANEQEVGTKETKALNKFRQIDVPLRVGYRFPVSQNFDLAVSGGFIFNLRSFNSGKQIDRSEDIVSYNRDNSDLQLYKTKLSVSYISSIKLEKEINSKLLLNGGLDFRLYTGNFNLSTNPIDQNYFKLGVSAGVRYRI